MAEICRFALGNSPKGVYGLIYGSISRNGDNVTVTYNVGMQNIDGYNGAYRYNRHAVCVWIDGANVLYDCQIKGYSATTLGRGYYGTGDRQYTFYCPDAKTIDVYAELKDTGGTYSTWANTYDGPWGGHGYLQASQNKSKINATSNRGSNWSKDKYVYKTTNYGSNWEKVNLYKTNNYGRDGSWTKIL